jgi:predicted polyphosphate/ATP-dependent NAD kinase
MTGIVTTAQQTPGRATVAQHWLARGAIFAAGDVGELARTVEADGADLQGVAGGDGTQALAPGIAAEHDVPLLVIAASTRNHSRGRRRCW